MTSNGEELSLESFWSALPSQDTQAREWLKGARITQEDLLKGGPRASKEAHQLVAERLSAADWWKATTQRGGYSGGHTGARPAGGNGPAVEGRGGGAGKGPLRMTFGKYKQERPLAVDIRERDPGYWTWCYENIAWWRAKVDEAGLGEENAA